MALVPYTQRQLSDFTQALADRCATEGPQRIALQWRQSAFGAWSQATGSIGCGQDGHLVWNGDDGAVLQWPVPRVQYAAMTVLEAVGNLANVAAASLQAERQAHYEQLAIAHDQLSAQQHAVHHEAQVVASQRDQQYAEYQVAMQGVQAQQDRLSTWEAQLTAQETAQAQQRQAIAQMSVEQRAAAEAESTRRAAEISADRDALRRQMRELEQLRAELKEAQEQQKRDEKEARDAHFAEESQRIRDLIARARTAPKSQAPPQVRLPIPAPTLQQQGMPIEEWASGRPQGFTIASVRSWADRCDSETDQDVLLTRIRDEAGFIQHISTPRERDAYHAVEKFIRAVAELAGWTNFQGICELGDTLVKNLRVAVAEDHLKIPPAQLRAKLAPEDYAGDSVGEAIAKLRSQQQSRTGRTVTVTGKCHRCGRGGHIAANCYAKKTVNGTPLSENGMGGADAKKGTK